MHRKGVALLIVSLLAVWVGGVVLAEDQPLPKPKFTQPSYPEKLEWEPRIAADTVFYQLASDLRITDKNAVTWTIPTLGFRDLRIVLFTTGAERTAKVVATVVKVSLIARDGDKEFDYFKKDISIDTGRIDGEAFSYGVNGENVTIRVEPRNMNGTLHLSAYLLK